MFAVHQIALLGYSNQKTQDFYSVLVSLSTVGFLYFCLTNENPFPVIILTLTNAAVVVIALLFLSIVNRINKSNINKFKRNVLQQSLELEQKEARYHAIFESSPAGIVIVDMDNNAVLDCNEQMMHIFRASKKEILSRDSLYFSPTHQPDGQLSSSKYIDIFSRYKKTLKPINEYWQYRATDGTLVDTDVYVRPISTGDTNLAVMQIQDITQRRLAERNRIKNEIYFRTLFDNGYEGILIFDLEQRRPFSCNQVALKLLGISQEEFGNFNFLKYAPSHQPNGMKTNTFVQRYLRKVLEEGKAQFEWVQRSKQGDTFYSEVSAFVLPEPEKQFAIIIFKDKTEKIVTQHALEAVSGSVIQGQEQIFYDSTVRSIADLLKVDYVLVGEWNILQATIEAKTLWAKSHAIHDLVYPIQDTPCEVVISSKEVQYYPTDVQQLFPKDQDLIDFDIESYLGFPLFDAEKNLIGHIAVMHRKPIKNPEFVKMLLKIYSQRLASEMAREKHQHELESSNAELKKVNSELDRFVYSAAHDIRAPISSVMGLINISEEQEDLEIIKYYLSLQKKSLNKLDLFITDLINYSINKRREVVHEEIRLRALFEQVIDQYKYLENYQVVDIQLQLEDSFPLFSDNNRLTLILNNLISNAINYADVNKKQPQIRIQAKISTTEASFEIWDNGQGIPENHLQKIFEMFHRASKHSKGSGIGLYITKEAIEKLGGKIQVTSEVGKWTKFTFTITNQLQLQESLERSS